MHSAGDDQQLDNWRGRQFTTQAAVPRSVARSALRALNSAMSRLLVAGVGDAVPRLGV